MVCVDDPTQVRPRAHLQCVKSNQDAWLLISILSTRPQKLAAMEMLDVVCVGDTHKTNIFGMPYFAIIGLDRDNKSRVLAQALITHQDIGSYKWVLDFVTRVMRGRQPLTVFSDGDQAIAAAIAQAFPGAKHFLCLWHFKGAHRAIIQYCIWCKPAHSGLQID